ncbi:hypothetical protein [Streptomyces pseudoechinosporeus]
MTSTPLTPVMGGELVRVRLGGGKDLPPEVGQAHPVPAPAADQQLSLEILFQVLDLRGRGGGADADVAAERRQGG